MTVRTAWVGSWPPTNHMWAVVLVIALALLALQARPDLSAHTNAVSDLDAGNLVADPDSMANDLVANADRKRNFAPAPVDGVDIRGAHSAALDLDIDIVGAKLLGFELCSFSVLNWIGRSDRSDQATNFLFLERCPVLLVMDHEAFKCVWVAHFCH